MQAEAAFFPGPILHRPRTILINSVRVKAWMKNIKSTLDNAMNAAPPLNVWLPEGSDMAQLVRAHDWQGSVLGPPSGWPESLRLVLGVCLASHFPIAIWWGPQLIQFYNDAYRPILGSCKHPGAFARPARATWPEIWPTIGPMVEQVMAKGQAVKGEDMPLTLDRNGYAEACFFTFSYSPIRDLSGAVLGMFTAAVETTERVLLQRQQAFQLDLADRLRSLSTPDDITGTACTLLARHLDAARVFFSGGDDAKQRARGGEGAEDLTPDMLATLRSGNVVARDARGGTTPVPGNSGEDALLAIPLVKSGSLVSVLKLHRLQPHPWSQMEIQTAQDMAERTWAALEIARAQSDLFYSRLELKKLARHQESVREDERKRIARDIHDDLGQNLMALRIDMSMMAAQDAALPVTREQIVAAVSQLDTTIGAVRAIINDLRPAVLDFGLHAAIEWQVREFQRRTGIACDLQADHEEFDMDDKVVTALFRIVQESLSNIVRHAKASHVHIAMRRRDARLFVTIADDGVGLAPPLQKGGFGLVGIEERILALGGTFSAANNPDSGMTLTVSLPMPILAPHHATLPHLEKNAPLNDSPQAFRAQGGIGPEIKHAQGEIFDLVPHVPGAPESSDMRARQTLHERLENRISQLTSEQMRINEALVFKIFECERSEEALQQSKHSLHQLLVHQELSKEDERKRIARELHDNLGQNLLALRIDISMLHARTAQGHPRLHEGVAVVLKNLDTTIKAVRSIISDLRPFEIELGLQAAVDWQLKRFERLNGFSCQLSIDKATMDLALDDEQTVAIFRILQESLSNIARHAQATRVEVALSRHAGTLSMTVRDNGVGTQAHERGKANGFGIAGIEQRMSSLGGSLSIDSGGSGKGTVLTINIPIKR